MTLPRCVVRAASVVGLTVLSLSCRVDDVAVGPLDIAGQPSAAHHELVITIRALPPMESGAQFTGLEAINNGGDAVGGAFTGGTSGVFSAAVWTAQDGGSLLPGVGPYASGSGRDINERGDIVGFGMPNPGRGLLWTKHGHTTVLPGFTVAHAINNQGTVVGASHWGTAITWTRKHGSRNLGGNFAVDINERGDIVGAAAGKAALWIRGEALVLLPTVPAQLAAEASGVNNHGTVIGFTGPHFFSTAFVWHESTGFRFLETPPGHYSHPEAINNHGEVVGWVTPGGADARRAALWTADGALVPLPGLVPGGGSVAHDINDRGEVAGVSATPDGGGTAVIWSVRR